MCVYCILTLRRIWYLLIPLHILILIAQLFCLWVPVIFELIGVRHLGLQVSVLSFLWLYCCQYQVQLLFNHPGIYLSSLEELPVCRLLRVYSGITGQSHPALIAEGLSLVMGLGFLVVPNCCPIVVCFQGLQLVQQLCSIWMVYSLYQNLVLVRWGWTIFLSGWSEWSTVLLLISAFYIHFSD